MADLKFSKVLDTPPASLQPDTVYFVKESADSVVMYITDSTPAPDTKIYKVNEHSAVDPLIFLGGR